MMLRNKIASAALITAITISTALPVYAQSNNSNSSGGFFGGIGRFFSRMFGGNTTQLPTPPEMPSSDNMPRVMPFGSGAPMMPGIPENMMEGTPGGKLDPTKIEEARLSGLVKAGKLTEEQKTAILAKLKSVYTELQTWAKAQGIDPIYVMPVPAMGMTPKSGGGPNDQTRPGMGTPSGMMRREEGIRPGQNGQPDNRRMMVPQGPR